MEAEEKHYVIIVAAGSGTRMGANIAKQYLPLAGKPILLHTIEVFFSHPLHPKVIVVLPQKGLNDWETICKQFSFDTSRCIQTIGGETRFCSVRNGLALIPENEKALVAIHDGVRPFVNVEVISRCFSVARCSQAAIPVMPVVESLRHVRHGVVPREDYRLVQTPQVFDVALLKRAYNKPYCTSFTDDASVVESLGVPISLVEGNLENIKITTPFDLLVAESLMKRNAEGVQKEHKITNKAQ